MAFTLNGFGTTFYGQSDAHLDGSFQTTEWFVVAHAPVIPLKTLRVVRNVGADLLAPPIYSHKGYFVLAELPVSIAQVARTYLFALAYGAWLAVAFWGLFVGLTDSTAAFWPMLGLILAFTLAVAVPFFLVTILRRRAFLKAIARHRATLRE